MRTQISLVICLLGLLLAPALQAQDSTQKTDSTQVDSVKCIPCYVVQTVPTAQGTSASQNAPKAAAWRDLPSTAKALLYPQLLITWFVTLLILGYIVWAMRDPNSHLRKALVETQDPDKISSSRLALFLSSLISILLALHFSVVASYGYLGSGKVPDFSSLINALLALGIGVVPYSVNKIGEAFKNRSPAPNPDLPNPIGQEGEANAEN
ncbi:MAG TPA: hypothetical protein DCE41_31650 [Cytophagales bacterium]|nr:hypothetical protein [Cytophagales bacterium]HAA23201.1 hypothetical protein [Cytophagales bacterium]HAP64812.1 hypothetical protein [Cytophagales bacterium]